MSFKKDKILLILILFIGVKIYAQDKDVAKIIKRISKSYDSTANMSFDILYSYSEKDIINKDSASEELKGNVIIAPKKSLFKLPDMEFMQNDSFYITVYNNKKFILIANSQTVNSFEAVPMLLKADSMVKYYSEHYAINMKLLRGIGTINFIAKDSIAMYRKFILSYNQSNYTIKSIKYVFEEKGEKEIYDDGKEDINDPISPKPYLKLITFNVDFNNYKFSSSVSNELYDEKKYIIKENGLFVPTNNYKDYTIYNSWQKNN